MLSLAGLPPLAGIFAKIYVFLAAMKAGLTIPAVLGVLASCVGAYYYLKIAKIIYFDEPARPFDRDMGRGMGTILALSTIFTVLFVFVPSPLVNLADARHRRCSGERLASRFRTGWAGQGRLYQRRGTPPRLRGRKRAAVDIAGAPDRRPRTARQQWHSLPGNLAATLLLRPDKSAAQCAQLSFAAALAVADMLARGRAFG